MIRLNTDSLEKVGRSDDTTYYLIEERILGAVPDDGTRDTESSARANITFLNGYFKSDGPGVVLVFMDALVSQDRAGRRTYQQELDPARLLGAGIIGGNMLGRAVGSAFIGLGSSSVPFKLFSNFNVGLEWARALVQSK